MGVECTLEKIVELNTKEGRRSLTSSLFRFLACLASQFLLDELGLSPDDKKLYSMMRAFFVVPDYPVETYYQALFEYQGLSKLMSFFPENKKDFEKWEFLKGVKWSYVNSKNKFSFPGFSFEIGDAFLSLQEYQGRYVACLTRYDGVTPVEQVGLGRIEVTNRSFQKKIFQSATSLDVKTIGMTETSFFDSCEDLAKLSEEQRKAVCFSEKKNVVILAGAGSGKTRTLSARFLYLHFVKRVPLDRMLLVTFTRRAKAGIQEKTVKLYRGITNDQKANVSMIKAKTIDAFFRQVITDFFYEIGFSEKPAFELGRKGKEKLLSVVAEIIEKNDLPFREKKVTPKFLQDLDVHMRGGRALDSNLDTLSQLLLEWQLTNNTIFTFTSANTILLDAIERNGVLSQKINALYDYVLIDEFQDINRPQNEIFKSMYDDKRIQFSFVGDDDQSIYFWRGSDYEIIKKIGQRDDTEEIFLGTNFRNNPYIVTAGNAILKQIQTRAKLGREIRPFQQTGSKIRIVDLKNDYSPIANEIQHLIDAGIKPGQIAVLCREGLSQQSLGDKKPLDFVVDALKARGIPYETRGAPPEFNCAYDAIKLILFKDDPSQAEVVANQLVHRLSANNYFEYKDTTDLTPGDIKETIIGSRPIEQAKYSPRIAGFLANAKTLALSIVNYEDSTIEDVIDRLISVASNLFNKTFENVLLKQTVFKELKRYSMNNPLPWPCRKEALRDFFMSFEDTVTEVSAAEDMDVEDMTTVKVSTIHSFKGLEFMVVFVVGLDQGRFPNIDKLKKERTKKGQELKEVIADATKAKKELLPRIKTLYKDLIDRGGKNVPEDILPQYEDFLDVIRDECDFEHGISTESLDSYSGAFSDYLAPIVNERKSSIGEHRADIGECRSRFSREMAELSKKIPAEEAQALRLEKEGILERKISRIAEAIESEQRVLERINSAFERAQDLNVLALSTANCLKNEAKIGVIENYLARLDEILSKQIEEERKLFYVAITRAAEILYLVTSEGQPSQFIDEIPDDCKTPYHVQTREEQQRIDQAVEKIQNIHAASDETEVDDPAQIKESTRLFSFKGLRDYLYSMEVSFFTERPVFNLVEGPARDYLGLALKHQFLQDYLGIDFTTEFLFNMQRAAEEFLSLHTGESAKHSLGLSQSDFEKAVNDITYIIQGCYTTGPTRQDIVKFLTERASDWRKRLKKCGIIHYVVRSNRYRVPKEIRNSFKYPRMENDPEQFLKAVIDISNYRNVFAHNHKPVWNGDPKDDALRFFEAIILNFYPESTIQREKPTTPKTAQINVNDKVISDRYGKGVVIKIDAATTQKKFEVDFLAVGRKTVPEDDLRPADEIRVKAKMPIERTPPQIFSMAIGKVFEITARFGHVVSQGTGFSITSRYVLTNAHVVTEQKGLGAVISQEIEASAYNLPAKCSLSVISYDLDKDLCLLEMKVPNGFPGLPMTSLPVSTGDSVVVIGNTKGMGICALVGHVSDSNRIVGGKPYIMFDAGVYHGNSGGPIFNTRGEVIGVVTAGDPEVRSINYAIPVDVIRGFLNTIKLS